ncbi:hypothetical protein [Fluviispira multicolorata]|uniref:Uncharacterized protein n=1 Tax=Fluviispira multicolorata TaxID=2654512 RepID=A0A833JAJ7_9BACT|nr:hypothetical protein [Fluviispira multicolorata]KAB8028099.1 hypothetical protein GCL57_13695 [Fluviispira multicolorata]
MSFKLKNIIFVQCCLANFLMQSQTFADTPKSFYSLMSPTSTFAALSGAGAAAPGDASMVDANPALLPALKKEYYFFGGAALQNQVDLMELGIFDSSSTPIAAVFRARETFLNDDINRDRRFTLGLAYQMTQIKNLSIGVSGEYQQLNLSEKWKWDKENYRIGAGLFYQIDLASGRPIFLGLSSNGMFDKFNPTVFDAGVSTVILDGYYTVNADALFDSNSGFLSAVSGLNVAVHKFFDIKGSVGYNPRESRFFWGTGIFFNGPVLRLYYTLVKTDSNDTTLRQTAGAQIALSL